MGQNWSGTMDYCLCILTDLGPASLHAQRARVRPSDHNGTTAGVSFPIPDVGLLHSGLKLVLDY